MLSHQKQKAGECQGGASLKQCMACVAMTLQGQASRMGKNTEAYGTVFKLLI
jgi:hypothetical protein